jgi:hypothetical protein
VYGEYETSLGPKAFLKVVHLAALCVAAWLSLGTVFDTLGRWSSKPIPPDVAKSRAVS